MGFFDFLKNKDKEKDNEAFWYLHKKTLENAKIEAQKKDEQFLQKFCPMVDGHCRADCVNFSKAYVSDWTGFNDESIRIDVNPPKCKLWTKRCI